MPFYRACCICHSPVTIEEQKTVESEMASYVLIHCWRCGPYWIESNITSNFLQLTDSQAVRISNWIKENFTPMLNGDRLGELFKLSPLKIAEKGERLLRYLAKKNPIGGTYFQLDLNPLRDALELIKRDGHISDSNLTREDWNFSVKTGLDLVGASSASNIDELHFILSGYLFHSKNFLSISASTYSLTPEGWSFLENVNRSESFIGFIAMSFKEDLKSLQLNGIEQGVREAGYEPLRVDSVEHSGKIDDLIIASIRKSRLIVADLTHQSHGVYFEAGFAMGLGIPIIWTCEKEELDKKLVHFDARQYNCIPWKRDNWSDLSIAIKNRIEALIGHGPKTYAKPS